ncbi:MAG TPA: hypothetical protein PLX72_09930, partial [Candidatus Syntrophosphaera sp.]|nr:hypothetical protein [Candidatus Syntrophosphaera sp.]
RNPFFLPARAGVWRMILSQRIWHGLHTAMDSRLWQAAPRGRTGWPFPQGLDYVIAFLGELRMVPGGSDFCCHKPAFENCGFS